MMGGTAIDTGFVLFILGLFSAIGGAWWRIESAIRNSKKEVLEEINKLYAEIDKVRSQSHTAGQAGMSFAQLVMTQLNEFKVEVAKDYVRRDGIKDLKDQLMEAVKRVETQVRDVQIKVERMVELETNRLDANRRIDR